MLTVNGLDAGSWELGGVEGGCFAFLIVHGPTRQMHCYKKIHVEKVTFSVNDNCSEVDDFLFSLRVFTVLHNDPAAALESLSEMPDTNLGPQPQRSCCASQIME